jgi:hypothetical protein
MMNAKLTVHCPASGVYMWLQWQLHGVPHSALYPWKAASGLGLKVAHAGETGCYAHVRADAMLMGGRKKGKGVKEQPRLHSSSQNRTVANFKSYLFFWHVAQTVPLRFSRPVPLHDFY